VLNQKSIREVEAINILIAADLTKDCTCKCNTKSDPESPYQTAKEDNNFMTKELGIRSGVSQISGMPVNMFE
jgi:hypothetical protein